MQTLRPEWGGSAWMTDQLKVFEASGLSKLMRRFTSKEKANLIDSLPG
jgi:hypothetical protein